MPDDEKSEHVAVVGLIITATAMLPVVWTVYCCKEIICTGVEGVARGLEGVHLADTCILTRLE
jgi:hypothetical protein